jgi:signal transduction histidine kinase
MAAQPGSRDRARRPLATRNQPEPLGPHALRIGLRTTLVAPLAAAASVAIFAEDGPGLGAWLPVFLGLVGLGAAVAFLPWDRLQGTLLGSRIVHVWAILDVLLITLAGGATGASHAALPLAYAVTIVFFAVVLSPAAQVAYVCFTLTCYGAVTFSTFEPLPFLMLAVVGALATFLSRELRRRIAAHDRARIDSERRWSVVGSVSSAARDGGAVEPRNVLQGVVEAIVTLGYRTAAIHLPDAQGELQLVLPETAAADPTVGIRTLPDAIRSRVLEDGRDAIVSVKDVDRYAARGLRSSGIETVAATPIFVGERPEGVLIVGSSDPDGIGVKEVEAFAVLAATAATAIGNARRADELRMVDEHLADADAVRADVLATLSKEVRKPLGAVTRSSRALRETFGNEDRHRLIERLVASATALDVTLGGSLDLSLLETSRVELHPEEVDVGALVSRVLARLAGLFEHRELRAHVPNGLTVEVDPGLFEQAVEHLLVTAATSTTPGKAVEVSVSRSGAETTVKVASDVVIPAEQLARIRQPLGQGNGGTGPWIRLALASRILELHGTELQTRSEPKRGTSAWFLLPGERPAEPALARRRSASAAETGPVQLSFDDALLPAVAAAAMRITPAPVEIDEPERSSTPLAAAALAATAATSLAVTGIVPQLLQHQDRPGVTSERREQPQQKKKLNDRKQRHRGSEDRVEQGTSNGTSGATSGSGTTSRDGTTGGTGGGTGGGGVSPTPSPTLPPPGHDGDPGKSGEAPGHNKTPSPSPSPTPAP